MKSNWEWSGLLIILYPNSSSFVQQSQPKLCRDLSDKLSCYAWFYSHRKNTLFTNRFFGAAWSFVSFRSLRRGWLYFGVLSSFPAFLLSGFPAFLISCFPAFLLFCFPSLRFSCFPAFTFFDVYTRLCKALCPHPGEVVYLTYLALIIIFHVFCI